MSSVGSTEVRLSPVFIIDVNSLTISGSAGLVWCCFACARYSYTCTNVIDVASESLARLFTDVRPTFLYVAPVIHQRVDGSQRGLLR